MDSTPAKSREITNANRFFTGFSFREAACPRCYETRSGTKFLTVLAVKQKESGPHGPLQKIEQFPGNYFGGAAVSVEEACFPFFLPLGFFLAPFFSAVVLLPLLGAGLRPR